MSNFGFHFCIILDFFCVLCESFAPSAFKNSSGLKPEEIYLTATRLLALMLLEVALAQANRLGCDFDQFVVFQKFNRCL
jgi:hypothetical protein